MAGGLDIDDETRVSASDGAVDAPIDDGDTQRELEALVDLSREIATGPLRRPFRNTALIVLTAILVALLGTLLANVFVVEQFAVAGESMSPAVRDGERIVVNKLTYRLHAVDHGDIVVFRLPTDGDRVAIKRVVGLAGDTIEIVGCVVRLNGTPLTEADLGDGTASGCGADQSPIVVPPRTVYVLGDNRGASEDSREFGPVPTGRLIGRAMYVVWPVGSWRGL